MRAVISRLAHLGAAPAALAEAVAILEGSGSLEVAAELAGLDPVAAEDAADALAGAGLLAATEPLDFAQPLVGAALRAEMGPFARARAHRRAAAVLEAAGAPVETVAAQLLHTRPAGEAETVARLREAAALALARGDAHDRAALLDRALAEPPPEAERAGSWPSSPKPRRRRARPARHRAPRRGARADRRPGTPDRRLHLARPRPSPRRLRRGDPRRRRRPRRLAPRRSGSRRAGRGLARLGDARPDLRGELDARIAPLVATALAGAPPRPP